MSKTTSDACVSWIEGRVPDTEEAGIVHALITERGVRTRHALAHALAQELFERDRRRVGYLNRKSTRLNSSHDQISYAVFCLKKKKRMPDTLRRCNNLACTTHHRGQL